MWKAAHPPEYNVVLVNPNLNYHEKTSSINKTISENLEDQTVDELILLEDMEIAEQTIEDNYASDIEEQVYEITEIEPDTENLVNIIRLHERIPLEIPLSEVSLTEWELFYLQHIVPIVPTIEETAAIYDFDPLFFVQVFLLESGLYPLAENNITNDFGLGQLKHDTFNMMYELTMDPKDIYYNPNVEPGNDIFHTETNIQFTFSTFAYNRNQTRYTDPVQLYTYYSRGPRGLNKDGSISDIGRPLAEAVMARYYYVEGVIPLLGLNIDEINQIQDTQTKQNLLIGLDSPGSEVAYQDYMEYNIDYLMKKGFPANSARYADSLYFATASQFAFVLEDVYSHDVDEVYSQLLEIGSRIIKYNQNDDVEKVVNKYIGLINKEITKNLDEIEK